jgi:hypothetical protein
MNRDSIQIIHYENWMLDQVIELFVSQYGVDAEEQKTVFRKFYEAPFQLMQGIRLVAIDGDKVCGFQSYFYWPYIYQGKLLRTFQSGNSLISENYRGRQIFARLLNFLTDEKISNQPEIDLLVGFPVDMSFGSFIRNKWNNPLDLQWFARLIHPYSVLRAYQPIHADWQFETEREEITQCYDKKIFSLSKDADFTEWRRNSSRDAVNQYLYLHHRDSNGSIRFDLKFQRRGRINELVLGDVIRSSLSPDLISAGLKTLIKVTKAHSFIAILTIALNERSSDPGLLHAIKSCGFFKLRNRIHFIIKPISNYFHECTDPCLWHLLRSDIDTW